MYQNVYYDKEQSIIHCWDDQKGYFTSKYRRYAYVRDGNGAFTSIHGERLKKINFWKQEDNLKLYESDVNEVTRFLIDQYGDSDEVSKGHTILTFDIEVEMNTGLPDIDKAGNAITSIAGHDSVTNDYFVYVVSDNYVDKTIKGAQVRSFKTEADLLESFLNKWQEINPTIVTGWNIDYFDVTYLYNRLKNVLGERMANKLSPIGKIGYNKYRNRYIIAGVSCLDYLALYKNFTYQEFPNYRLDTIANIVLGRGKIEYQGNLDQLFRDDLEKFIEYNLVDVELVVEMDRKLQFIELAQAICHAGHVFYEDFLFSSKWLEGAILTFLRRSNRVAPDKSKRAEKNEDGSDSEGKFTGAYVKEPNPGLYKWVYDLDLTSLYPSIIMTLNVSPETKIGKLKSFSSEDYMKDKIESYSIVDDSGAEFPPMTRDEFQKLITESNYSLSSNGVLYTQDRVGVIPEILNVWFDKRVEYKDLMKKYGNVGNDELYKFYSQRQLVQKIMLNSLYGVLGLPSFRFYDIDNAEATTITGQMVIKTTEMIANQYYKSIIGKEGDYNVYTDTDSVFYQALPLVQARNPNIDPTSDEQMVPAILSVAQEVQAHINKVYDTMSKKLFNVNSHRFDIKQETIAKGGFWVSKKRYAQWIINDNTVPCDKMDVKGLDVRRSSFPTYFKKVMETVLLDILKGVDKSEIDTKLIDYKSNMENQTFKDIAKNSAVKDMSKYVNARKEYALGEFEKGTPAHVKAAITYNRLLKYYKAPYKYEPMKDGDKIKWVYLKKNPLGLETTAFTGHNDPPQINQFVQQYIDYNKIWKQDLENKLDDFYDAMNWDKPNPNLQKASQFFGF
jgi:DNA polymerase elongation subunit (family B)